jgi:uncharacterized protein YcfJ
MLPKVHTERQRQEREVGQVRGAVYEAVCGQVLGREFGGAEGVGEIEAIEREWVA